MTFFFFTQRLPALQATVTDKGAKHSNTGCCVVLSGGGGGGGGGKKEPSSVRDLTVDSWWVVICSVTDWVKRDTVIEGKDLFKQLSPGQV